MTIGGWKSIGGRRKTVIALDGNLKRKEKECGLGVWLNNRAVA